MMTYIWALKNMTSFKHKYKEHSKMNVMEGWISELNSWTRKEVNYNAIQKQENWPIYWGLRETRLKRRGR